MQPHLHTIGEWKAEMNLADHILCNNINAYQWAHKLFRGKTVYSWKYMNVTFE